MIDEKLFALAVVASSSPDLSVKEKGELYLQAEAVAREIQTYNRISQVKADEIVKRYSDPE